MGAGAKGGDKAVLKMVVEQNGSVLLSLRQVAQDALIDLIQNVSTPAHVRAGCARTLLELCGAIGSGRAPASDNPDTDPETMSLADIERRLSALDEDTL